MLIKQLWTSRDVVTWRASLRNTCGRDTSKQAGKSLSKCHARRHPAVDAPHEHTPFGRGVYAPYANGVRPVFTRSSVFSPSPAQYHPSGRRGSPQSKAPRQRSTRCARPRPPLREAQLSLHRASQCQRPEPRRCHAAPLPLNTRPAMPAAPRALSGGAMVAGPQRTCHVSRGVARDPSLSCGSAGIGSLRLLLVVSSA